jgi:carbon monoxide dehydrogenase subunit G
MELSGEYVIGASKKTVWAALNDPEMLQACLPSCKSAEILWDTEDGATAATQHEPASGRFNCKFLPSDPGTPNGYTNSQEGQDGIAVLATGSAHVSLADEGGRTRLTYWIDAELGGKLADFDAATVDSVKLGYVEAFFAKFAAHLAPAAPHADEALPAPVLAPHEDHDHDPTNPHYFGLPVGVIIAACIALISVGAIFLKFLK